MRKLTCLVFLNATLGCSHLILHRADSARPTGPSREILLDSYIWSFTPGTPVPPEKDLCPQSRIETIEMKMSGQDVLLTCLTLGLYVPHRLEITCAKTAAADQFTAPAK